ncbi:MAG: hypothetical protein J2P33_03985, partial [Actinobacteria bacterium]|nr:hypothetical protein [Actinomycetota bacterium]
MHPREGWSEDRPRLEITRRGFLGTGLAAGGLSALLAACGTSTTTGSTGPTAHGIPLPRPNHPVTWPVFSGNKPIKSGLPP